MSKFRENDRVIVHGVTDAYARYNGKTGTISDISDNGVGYSVAGIEQNNTLYFIEEELALVETKVEAKEVPEEAPKVDMVNHPPHYTQYEGFEVIDVVKQLPYLKGTAVKYIMRAGAKWDELEDLKKAVFYLNKQIAELEKEEKSG